MLTRSLTRSITIPVTRPVSGARVTSGSIWTPAALFAKGQTLVFDFVDGRYATKSLVDGSIDYSTTPSDLMTVQRASPKWVYDETGTLVEVPVDTLAIQHDPLTGESQGALIEESRTNLLLWSEDFTQWSRAEMYDLALDGTRSPDGEANATRFTTTSSMTSQYITQSTFPDGPVCRSIQVKPGEVTQIGLLRSTNGLPTAKFDLINNVVYDLVEADDAGIIPLNDGWVLCYVSGIAVNYTGLAHVFLLDDNGSASFTGDDESGIYIWGAQLEEGSTPSSYIPTTDSPVTRAADSVSRVLDDEYDPNAGTYTIRAAVPSGETVATLGSVSVTSTSDEMTTYTLSYSSDPGATELVLGNGLFESIEYTPGVS